MNKIRFAKLGIVAAILVFIATKLGAEPWPGLSGYYPSNNGCVFLLLEMTVPNGGNPGRVAFTHNPTSETAGEIYFRDVPENEWGTYGFNGTGIIYASGEAWSGWDSFWAPWGNWW